MSSPPPLFFVGSLPFKTASEGLAFVRENSPHLPFLPQLPHTNAKETMISQALRGMQLGKWNNDVSCCFEDFFTEYAKAPRAKIQLAGPFTVAWFSSKTFQMTESPWRKMWEGLIEQIRASFSGELWVQIDEPIWSGARPLPPAYPDLLDFLGKTKNVKLGLHSCAEERTLPNDLIREKCSFFSFDYTKSAMIDEEKIFWNKWLGKDRVLVTGLVDRYKGWLWKSGFKTLPTDQTVWIGAGCGLAEWTEKEMKWFGAKELAR